MNLVRVGLTSDAERMKILDVVPGSNQRLIQLQTVGKKLGAPMIWRHVVSFSQHSSIKCIQKCGPESLDNAPKPAHWHPAYGSSGSRTASSPCPIHRQCLSCRQSGPLYLVAASRCTVASRTWSCSHTEQTVVEAVPVRLTRHVYRRPLWNWPYLSRPTCSCYSNAQSETRK